MSHTYSRLLVHIIFSTKERRPDLNDEIRPRIFGYMNGIAERLDATAITVGGVIDHAHMLVQFPTTLAVAELVGKVKGNSSLWAHETWPDSPFAWQTGYAAFSVSQSNAGDVIRYIASQEEHHRKFSFKDELLAVPRLTPWANQLSPLRGFSDADEDRQASTLGVPPLPGLLFHRALVIRRASGSEFRESSEPGAAVIATQFAPQ